MGRRSVLPKQLKTPYFTGITAKYKLQIAILAIFLMLWLIFFAINPSGFSNPYTYTAMLSVAPFTIIPALSLTYVIILGEIDLSFPSVMALGALVLTLTWKTFGPTPLGLLLALSAGLLAGLLNGILITKFQIPSLIATIGTMFLWRGFVLVVTQGYGIPLGEYRGLPIYEMLVGRIGIIPVQIIWTVVIALVLWVILNFHKFGAYVYYTGDNRIAAKMLGINTDKVIISVYMIHGAIAAFAGVLATLEMATFWPALGEIYLLKSIASVIVGGTPVTGGIGTIFGTFIGGLILELIETGILAAGVTGFWIRLVHGLVIIIALIAQVLIRRSEMRRMRVVE